MKFGLTSIVLEQNVYYMLATYKVPGIMQAYQGPCCRLLAWASSRRCHILGQLQLTHSHQHKRRISAAKRELDRVGDGEITDVIESLR